MLPFQKELRITTTNLTNEGDHLVEIVLPLELARRTRLIEAIKSQNNERVNKELLTLLQCIDVNRLSAVKRLINQLKSVEWFSVTNEDEYQLYTYFLLQLEKLYEDFRDQHPIRNQNTMENFNRFFDNIVTALSIYQMIIDLGFVSETSYSRLFLWCLDHIGIVLNEFGIEDEANGQIMKLNPSVEAQVLLLTH